MYRKNVKESRKAVEVTLEELFQSIRSMVAAHFIADKLK
jgi:hypothetical protein